MKQTPTEPQAPTLLQTLGSVAAAFFGVQSSKNRQRDFRYGKPLHFIVLGFALTAVVVMAFWAAAQLALHWAQ